MKPCNLENKQFKTDKFKYVPGITSSVLQFLFTILSFHHIINNIFFIYTLNTLSLQIPGGIKVTKQNKCSRHQRSHSTIEWCSSEKGRMGLVDE